MATYIVTSNVDGAINASNDPTELTLREALAKAKANAGTDTITFDPTVFETTDTNGNPVKQTITLTEELAVDSNVTITGPANGLIIDAADQGRAFNVSVGQATMTGLTVTNGTVSGDGGAILVQAGASLTFTDGVISESIASANGGGVAVEDGGTLTLVNTTVAGNTATGGQGGGVWNDGTATLTNVTVYGNDAPAADAGAGEGAGDGLFTGASATTNLNNSIVAGNTGGDNDAGAFVGEDANNLTDADTPVAADIFSDNDGAGIDLADNGAPAVQTIALKSTFDNAALNAGDADFAPATDARGEARPANEGDDLGAFELSYEEPTARNDAVAVAEEDENGNATVYNSTLTNSVLINDSAVTASNDLDVTSITVDGNDDGEQDTADEPASGVITSDGQFGQLVMNAEDGTYTYTVKDTLELEAGQSASDVFTYTVAEADNFRSTATLMITVNGTNTAPTAANDTVDQDGTASNVIDTDFDNDGDIGEDGDDDGDTLTVTGAGFEDGDQTDVPAGGSIQVAGEFGTLTIGSDGAVSYKVDAAKFASLGEGQDVNEVFSYTVSDGKGGTATAEITVNVDGENEAPEAADVSATAAEAAAGQSATVADAITDADTDTTNDDGTTANTADVVIVSGVKAGTDEDDNFEDVSDGSETVDGTYGTLTISASGAYSYAVDTTADAFVKLDKDEVAQEVFTYQVDDQSGADNDTDTATLSISVTGTNQDPNVYEGTTPSDDDYELDASAAGEDDKVALTLSDPDDGEDEDTVSVTKVSFSGAAGADDDDEATVTADAAGTVQGKYGTLTIDADGGFFYTENLSAKTGSVTDVFTVTASDVFGETDTATITITPTIGDDAPKADDDAITAAAAGKGGDVLTNDSDVDEGDEVAVSGVKVSGAASFQSTFTDSVESVTTDKGVLTINRDGSYTYAKLSTAEADENGVLDTFEYKAMSSGGDDTATLTIFAMADAVDDEVSMADAAEGENALANDEAAVSTGGTLAVDGLKVGEGEFVAVTSQAEGEVMGTYGTLTIEADGDYSYEAMGEAYAALKAGEAKTDAFTYRVTDGSASDTATITVAVTGANDMPSAGDVTVAAADAEAGDEATVAGFVADVDGDAPTVSGIMLDGEEEVTAVSANGTLVQGQHGILSIKSDGSYSYQVASDAPAKIGEGTDDDVFAYTVTDADGGTATAKLSVTVTGQAPVADNGGDDVVTLEPGLKRFKAGAGDDEVTGSTGKDKIIGEAGDDMLDGGAGNDKLKGGAGDDVLRGGSGKDKLNGGAGDDTLDGQAGNDKMKGREGADTFVYLEGKDVIKDFEAADTIELSSSLFEGQMTAAEVMGEFGEQRKDDVYVLRFDDEDVLKIKGEIDAIEDSITFG